jgi:hypothetical protein
MKKNNLMHKEYLFKIQKMIISDELTEMLKSDRKEKSRLCAEGGGTGIGKVGLNGKFFDDQKHTGNLFSKNISASYNDLTDKEFEVVSTSDGTYTPQIEIRKYSKIILKPNESKFNNSNQVEEIKNSNTNKSTCDLPSFNTNNLNRRNTLNTNSNISRRFSKIIQICNVNNNYTSLNNNKNSIDETKEILIKTENKILVGVSLISKDIDKQTENFKKRLKEKKSNFLINKNRKISEENSRASLNTLNNVNNISMSMKHFLLHRRNLSNISLNSLNKKKFDEDNNDTQKDEYKDIIDSNSFRNVFNNNNNHNTNLVSRTSLKKLANNSNHSRKISSNLYSSHGVFTTSGSKKNSKKCSVGFFNTNTNNNNLNNNSEKKKNFNSNNNNSKRKSSKHGKKTHILNEQLEKILVELKNKLTEAFKAENNFLIDELKKEFDAKQDQCKEGLDSLIEFELLLQSAEGELYIIFFIYILYIFLDPDYKKSLKNIICSMEDELNVYYTEMKALTFDKLMKNYEVVENCTNLNYDEKIDVLIKDLL